MRPLLLLLSLLAVCTVSVVAQRTVKPPLHGLHWVAITGKPLGATAGAMVFQRGGNAVDAACAMLGAVSTMWDTLSWGGETQALIYNPVTKRVVGINALGVAPTGATPEFFKSKGMKYPPEYGPLAAVTPGTPGGLMVMLAEFGTMSLKDVLEPAIQMADGYPIEQQLADTIERDKKQIKEWPYAKAVMLPHLGEAREAPAAGEIRATWQRRCGSWSKPSSRRSRPARTGRPLSTPHMTASTRATSRASSSAAHRSRAACTRWRTWPTGSCTLRSRS
jgi:gamma-glutamyltranspeptidase/glutathione hydrolase